MDFIIRKARVSDAKDIGELYIHFFEVNNKEFNPLIEYDGEITLENQMELAKKDIESSKNHILVAEGDGKVIGSIEFVIKKNWYFYKIKEYGRIDSLITHKNHRRQGVATALIEACMEFMKERGIRYVRTLIYDINEASFNTFEKIGFERQSTILIKEI